MSATAKDPWESDPWEAPAGGASDPWETPAKETPGLGTKALHAIAIPTQVRDAALTSALPVRAMDALRVKVANALGYKAAPMSRRTDLQHALQAEGATAGDYLTRAGVNPGVAGPAGFGLDVAGDIAAPWSNPVGKLAGDALSGTSNLLRGLGSRRLLQAARTAGRDPEAVLDTLKEMGVAGGYKNQAAKVKAGIELLDGKVNAKLAQAGDAGASVNANAFADEAAPIQDQLRRYGVDGDFRAGRVQGVVDQVQRAAEQGKLAPKEARPFLKEWGGSGNPDLWKLRAALRERVTSDLPGGSEISDLLAREGHLLTVRGAANRAAGGFSRWGLMRPAAGAIIGGWRGARNSDGFDPTHLGTNALLGAGLAYGLTSPWFLTRVGGQALGAAAPYAGSAATQGAYRLLPEEENQ